MHRSSLLARLLTIVTALVVTPIAIGLLSSGGYVWANVVMTRYAYGGPDLAVFAGPVAMQLLGLLLLAGVVITGVWSSAGLLAIAVLGLIWLVLSAIPAVMIEVYRGAGSILPQGWMDGSIYGIALALYAALGAMGLVLFSVRRRPSPGRTGAALLGILLAPLALLIGGWLFIRGVAGGQMQALMLSSLSFNVVATLAVLGGLLLIVLGIGVTHWSPWALLLPAVALLAATAVLMFPDSYPILGAVLPADTVQTAFMFFLLGGGTATAVVYLAFTAVMHRMHARASSAPQAVGAPQTVA